jgi:hypothetical protein
MGVILVLNCPYRDCKCSFHDLSNPNPNCVYVTMNEMREAKRELRNNEAVGLIRFKQISRHPIKNALTVKYMPLSDMHHGPSAMMPPKLLHASMAGMRKIHVSVNAVPKLDLLNCVMK